MGEHNSPYFAAGCADGERDTQLNTSHPGGGALGPDSEKVWSWMYKRGYEGTFDSTALHMECEECESSR